MAVSLCNLLILCLALVACERIDPRMEKAQEIWVHHERVFVALSQGKKVDALEFDEACKFFTRLTDVEIPADHNPMFDCFPSSKSQEALAPLREWYASNAERLYWDEASGEVLLRKE